TFTITNSQGTVGAPVAAAVHNGVAQAFYPIPGGQTAASLSGDSITVSYSDSQGAFSEFEHLGGTLTVYNLANDGTLTQVGAGGSTVIDTAVDAAAGAGVGVLDLKDNGQLWLRNGSSSQLLDVGAASFQTDGRGDVAILESNGTLRTYSPAAGLS